MSVLSELEHTLHAMGIVQMVLMFSFLTSYSLALGAMFDATGRRRAGLAALIAAAGFVATTAPWVHGAIVIAFAVVGMGLFIVAVSLLSAALGLYHAAAIPAVDTGAPSHPFFNAPTPARALAASEALPSRARPK